MNQDLSREVLEALQKVHDRMKQRMMLHPEYCAMVALEKSMASISEIFVPQPEDIPADEPEEPEQEIETAIAETIAAKVAPAAPVAPIAPRIAPAAFLPMQRMGGQAMGMR